jgi:hypothetical protein
MQIFWHGFSCIRIEATHGDQQASLVTDPYSNETGLRFPRTLAPDIVALTHEDDKRFPTDAFTNEPFIVRTPGEYEVKRHLCLRHPAPHAGRQISVQPHVPF